MVNRITLFLAFIIAIAMTAFIVYYIVKNQYLKENKMLNIKYSKQLQVNSKLATERYYTKTNVRYLEPEMNKYDSLYSLVDSMAYYFPIAKEQFIKKWNTRWKIVGDKRYNPKIPLDSFYTFSENKESFALGLTMEINKMVQEKLSRICVEYNSVELYTESYYVVQGIPMRARILVVDNPFNEIIHAEINGIKYLPEDGFIDIEIPTPKVGSYLLEGKVKLTALGDTFDHYFVPREFIVTYPIIRSILVEKEILDLNKPNQIQFNFGGLKQDYIDIKVDGGTLKFVKNNLYILKPSQKQIKITYSGKKKDVWGNVAQYGFIEYEAR